MSMIRDPDCTQCPPNDSDPVRWSSEQIDKRFIHLLVSDADLDFKLSRLLELMP